MLKEKFSDLDELFLNSSNQDTFFTCKKQQQTIDEFLILCLFLYKKQNKSDFQIKLLQLWSYFYTLSIHFSCLPTNYLKFSKLVQNYYMESFKIELNSHFVIRNQLPGFRYFLQCLLNNAAYPTEECFQTFLSAKELLIKEYRNVFLIFLKLDLLEKTNVKNLMVDFFWTLFDSLEFDEKIEIIQLLATSSKVKRKKDGSICSLYEKTSFNNDTVQFINKLSFDNFENIEVIFIIKHFFRVFERSIFNDLFIFGSFDNIIYKKIIKKINN